MMQPVEQAEPGQKAFGPVAPGPLLGTGIDRGHFDVADGIEIGQQLVALEDEAEILAPQRGDLIGI